MFERASKAVIEKSQQLSELDMIGDADFGTNISTGFERIVEKLSTIQDADVGTILSSAGDVFVFDIGSTIGGLIGRGFQKAGRQMQGKQKLNCRDIVSILESLLTTIQEIGQAKLGDKTLIDALEPAKNAAAIAVESGTTKVYRLLSIAASAAGEGARGTAGMVSRVGRSSYLGERSRGTIDPGAMFIYIFLEAMSYSSQLDKARER
jgi:dihydroxyacetone kinase-like protein